MFTRPISGSATARCSRSAYLMFAAFGAGLVRGAPFGAGRRSLGHRRCRSGGGAPVLHRDLPVELARRGRLSISLDGPLVVAVLGAAIRRRRRVRRRGRWLAPKFARCGAPDAHAPGRRGDRDVHRARVLVGADRAAAGAARRSCSACRRRSCSARASSRAGSARSRRPSRCCSRSSSAASSRRSCISTSVRTRHRCRRSARCSCCSCPICSSRSARRIVLGGVGGVLGERLLPSRARADRPG